MLGVVAQGFPFVVALNKKQMMESNTRETYVSCEEDLSKNKSNRAALHKCKCKKQI